MLELITAKPLLTVNQSLIISYTNSFTGLLTLQVGDPAKSTKVCNDLLTEYGIYVQAINYPTVPRGEEKLRIAPTPFHNEEMMDRFVASLVRVWAENGLDFLTPVCTATCDCQERCQSNFDLAFNRHATPVGA